MSCVYDIQPTTSMMSLLSFLGNIGGILIQVLHNAMGVGWEGVKFTGKKHYEGVQFNVFSVYNYDGWVGVNFPEKNVRSVVTLE